MRENTWLHFLSLPCIINFYRVLTCIGASFQGKCLTITPTGRSTLHTARLFHTSRRWRMDLSTGKYALHTGRRLHIWRINQTAVRNKSSRIMNCWPPSTQQCRLFTGNELHFRIFIYLWCFNTNLMGHIPVTVIRHLSFTSHCICKTTTMQWPLELCFFTCTMIRGEMNSVTWFKEWDWWKNLVIGWNNCWYL